MVEDKKNTVPLFEGKRTYYFGPKDVLSFEGVQEITISDSGVHRIKTAEQTHIIPPKWLAVIIEEPSEYSDFTVSDDKTFTLNETKRLYAFPGKYTVGFNEVRELKYTNNNEHLLKLSSGNIAFVADGWLSVSINEN